MFCHRDLLLARYKEAENQPFVVIDKSTMTPILDETKEKPFTAAKQNRVSLAWTPLDTEYSENESEGNRWFRQAPFCSDGEYIYTMVFYRKQGFDSPIIRTMLEIYQVDEKSRELKLRQEVVLYKRDGTSFYTGSHRRMSPTFLQQGCITCNGKVLILFNRNTQAWDVRTG